MDTERATHLTFIAAEHDDASSPQRMGVLGVCGTVEQARELVTPFLDRSELARCLIRPQESVTHPVVASWQKEDVP